jgi:hypothetical protein
MWTSALRSSDALKPSKSPVKPETCDIQFSTSLDSRIIIQLDKFRRAQNFKIPEIYAIKILCGELSVVARSINLRGYT